MQQDKEEGTHDERYVKFLRWFIANGGYMRDIKYDRFQPTDYLGIAAEREIKKNTVIMGVPKRIIIGIDRVRESELQNIIERYPLFEGETNDDKDFNILALFLIMEKMKKEDSFFAPYLNCIDIAQTLIHWTDQEIEQLGDPFLNVNFVHEIKADFETIFLTFTEIVQNNPAYFRETLTRELFDTCYGMVMTRCFGWGLPETMLVPFADFMNHHSNGVHHYAFSLSLQAQNEEEYFKKSSCLDLSIFGKDNKKNLPIDYEKDSREAYIDKHKELLEKEGIILSEDVRRLYSNRLKQYLNIIRSKQAKKHFQCALLLSSDSEDNDSIDEEEYKQTVENPKVKQNPLITQFYEYKQFFRKTNHMVDVLKDPKYVEPKPSINEQFEENVSFGWWTDQNDSQFIVATSKTVGKGDQIFNSYGRRNNRFLLLWYGFAFEDNKYDSVAFRLWSTRVAKETSKIVFTRYLTEKDWKCRIPIGNKRYPYSQLTEQYRLKLPQLNYYFIAFLRFKTIMDNRKYAEYESKNKHMLTICHLQLEIQVFMTYLDVLKHVDNEYDVREREFDMRKNYRACFARILRKSNRDILEAHNRGVRHILNLLRTILESRHFTSEDLLQVYRSDLREESQAREQASRVFVKHYYKQLCDFLEK